MVGLIPDQNPNKTPSLNIAAIYPETEALGPGIRSAIWVQGCPFHCKGCIAPDWIPFTQANLINPLDLADQLSVNSRISGITISGGEPMLQARELAEMVRAIKRVKDINVICFTGYLYQQLTQQTLETGIPGFLQEIDVLIDGPYIQSRNIGVGLRGSDNQNIVYLTDRLKDYDLETFPRRLEINYHDQEIFMIGIPPINIDTLPSLYRSIHTPVGRD